MKLTNGICAFFALYLLSNQGVIFGVGAWQTFWYALFATGERGRKIITLMAYCRNIVMATAINLFGAVLISDLLHTPELHIIGESLRTADALFCMVTICLSLPAPFNLKLKKLLWYSFAGEPNSLQAKRS